MLGAARVTVTAGRLAYIENHRGILEYSPQRVRIAALPGELTVSGDALELAAMNAGELLLRGKIQSVEWG